MRTADCWLFRLLVSDGGLFRKGTLGYVYVSLPYGISVPSSGCVVSADIFVEVLIYANDAVGSFQDGLANIEGEIVWIVVAFYMVIFRRTALVLCVFGSNGNVGTEIEERASFCRNGRACSGRRGLFVGGKGGRAEEGCR